MKSIRPAAFSVSESEASGAVKRLPNILTLLRGLGAAAHIGLDVNRVAFWLVYALCGLSDMLDGLLTRRLHAESVQGERLDSAADGFLVVACAVTLLPLCAFPLWGWIGALTIARAFAMLRMRALRHTRLNRLCGLILWLGMPLIVRCFWAAVPACLLASAVQDARFMRKP